MRFFLVAALALGCAPTPPAPVPAPLPVLDPCAKDQAMLDEARALRKEGRLDRAYRLLGKTKCESVAADVASEKQGLLAELEAKLAPQPEAHAPLEPSFTALVEGDAAGALAGFEAALSADRADARALLGAGLALRALGRRADAQRMLDRALWRFEEQTGQKARAAVLNETSPDVEATGALLLPERTRGSALYSSRLGGWTRWLGRGPAASLNHVVRFDENRQAWLVVPRENADRPLGAFDQAAISRDETRAFACNEARSVVLSLPDFSVLAEQSHGCHAPRPAWQDGDLLVEGDFDRDGSLIRGDIHVATTGLLSLYRGTELRHVFHRGARVLEVQDGDDQGDGRDVVLVAADDAEELFRRRFARGRSHGLVDVTISANRRWVGVAHDRMLVIDRKNGSERDIGASPEIYGAVAPAVLDDGRVCATHDGRRWRIEGKPRAGRVAPCFPDVGGVPRAAAIQPPKGRALLCDMEGAGPECVGEAVSPDGKTVAVLGYDGGALPPESFELWLMLADADTGAVLHDVALGSVDRAELDRADVAFEDAGEVTVQAAALLLGVRVDSGATGEARPWGGFRIEPQAANGVSFMDQVDVRALADGWLVIDPNAGEVTLTDREGKRRRRVELDRACNAASDGRTIAAASCAMSAGAIEVWPPDGGPLGLELPYHFLDGLAVHGDRVAVLTDSGLTLARVVEERVEVVRSITVEPRPETVLFGSDGKLLVGMAKGQLYAWSSSDGAERWSLARDCQPLVALPEGRFQCGSEVLDGAGQPLAPGSEPFPMLTELVIETNPNTSPDFAKMAPNQMLYALDSRVSRAWLLDAGAEELLAGGGAFNTFSRIRLADGERLATHVWAGGTEAIHAMGATPPGRELSDSDAVLYPTREVPRGALVRLNEDGTAAFAGDAPPTLACRFGDVLAPFAVCEDRLRVR